MTTIRYWISISSSLLYVNSHFFLKVLQIETALAKDSFPLLLNGYVSGIPNKEFYYIHKGKRPSNTPLPAINDSLCELYQENARSKFTRALHRQPFNPTMKMYGYNKGVIAKAEPIVESIESYPKVVNVKAVREIASKEGFKIFGPKDQVLIAEHAIRAALMKEARSSEKAFNLDFSAPEEWETVLQRLR